MAIIVIDGPDGSGKTTTAKKLVEHINQNPNSFGNNKAIYYKSPAEPFGNMCTQLDSSKDLNPNARLLFFMAALHQDSQEIQKLIDKGHHVVLDRYWHTTLAFHKTLSADTDNIFNTTGLIKEDLNVILNADDNTLNNRIVSRANQKGEELSWWENPEFQHSLRIEFNTQAQKDSKALLINTNDTPKKEVLSKIAAELKKLSEPIKNAHNKLTTKPNR